MDLQTLNLQINRHLKRTSVRDFLLLIAIIFRQVHTEVFSSLRAMTYKQLEKLLEILFWIRPQGGMTNFKHFGEHYIFHIRGDSSKIQLQYLPQRQVC